MTRVTQSCIQNLILKIRPVRLILMTSLCLASARIILHQRLIRPPQCMVRPWSIEESLLERPWSEFIGAPDKVCTPVELLSLQIVLSNESLMNQDLIRLTACRNLTHLSLTAPEDSGGGIDFEGLTPILVAQGEHIRDLILCNFRKVNVYREFHAEIMPLKEF